jgi:hypothetical protein
MFFAGPGAIPRPALPVVLEATGDTEDARRAWTAVYDLLLLGRIRGPDEIDEYDEPPTVED